MPEILVQLVDETDPDFYINVSLPKQGDVLTLHDVPNSWGDYFTQNPHWRIVSVAGQSSDFYSYLISQMETDPQNPSRVLQFRQRSLDITKLTDGMTLEDLQAITTVKPIISDANSLDEHSNIF